MQKPNVSVLMGVYNGNPDHITEAVQSVLDQDWRDFEFIIVDDGSKPQIQALLANFAANDKRIVLLQNKSNIGLTASLNIALARAHGNFIARMDADDICSHDRLSTQVEFLQTHSSIGVVGGRFDELLNQTRIPQRLPFLSGADNIRSKIIYFNPLCHSSIMARREAILEVGGYNEKFKHAQDYDLWLRISRKWDIENLNRTFIVRRMEDGISIHAEQSQRKYALKARWHALLRGDYLVSAILALAWYGAAILVGNHGQALYRKMKELRST